MQINGAALVCITVEEQPHSFDPTLAVHCVNKEKPVLRIDTNMGGIYHTIYNDAVPFRGAYVPRSIGVSKLGKPFVRVRIDTLESLSTVDESAFTPPSSAQLITRRISLARSGVQLTTLSKAGRVSLRKQPPNSAPGAVILHVLIDTNGKVAVQTLNGPTEFADPLADSIRQLTYKPVEYEGEIVEVEYLTYAKIL